MRPYNCTSAWRARVIVAAFSFVALASARAQDPTPGSDLPTDGNGPMSTSTRGVTVIPVVRSTPQLGFGAGAVGALTFKMDSASSTSGLGIGGVYTATRSWMVGLGGRVYFREDHYKATAGFAVSDVRYDFFGVGTDAGDAGESIRLIQRGSGTVFELIRRVAHQFYVGPRIRYSSVSTKLENDTASALRTIAMQEPSYATSALGAAAEYDSRDDQLMPHRGALGRFAAMYARSPFGSDNSFDAYIGSFNAYLPVAKQSVLAARISECSVGRHAPLTDLCLYGVNSDLRGYDGGRYRDLAMFAAQAEWRSPITSHVAYAIFAGVGGVASAFSAYSASDLLPSGGVGLRYLAWPTPHVNLGADYAVGKNKGAFYLRVGEAF
jgi:outer membrane protein assembly factor BamA